MADQITDPAHESTAAREHDAAIDDIGCQFGRGTFKSAFHRFNDHVQRFDHRLADVSGTHIDGAGKPGQQVQTPDIHGDVVMDVVREC